VWLLISKFRKVYCIVSEKHFLNIFLVCEYFAKLQAKTWLSHAVYSSFRSVVARMACVSLLVMNSISVISRVGGDASHELVGWLRLWIDSPEGIAGPGSESVIAFLFVCRASCLSRCLPRVWPALLQSSVTATTHSGQLLAFTLSSFTDVSVFSF